MTGFIVDHPKGAGKKSATHVGLQEVGNASSIFLPTTSPYLTTKTAFTQLPHVFDNSLAERLLNEIAEIW